MRKGAGAARTAGAFAACALLAAPAPAQEGCGDLEDCLRPLAKDVAGVLGREALAQGERLDVSFRPAWTEPQGVLIYCQALSRGLRNALHEGVREERDAGLNFDLRTPDRMRVNPPEVGMAWTPDRTGGGREILDVDVIVTLEEGREERMSGEVPASALSRAERACLFSFERRREGGRVEAAEDGDLFADPSYSDDAWAADYEKGDKLRVRGCVTAGDRSGDVWPVVAWRNPDTRERRNLFAPDLADACGPPPPPPPGTVFRDCPHCPEMVVVPAGSFDMGSPASEEGRFDAEGPQHRVTIGSNFAVGVHEVTRGEFARFVSATERSTGDSCGTYESGAWEELSGRSWRSPGFPQADSHPVVCVTWEDARAYAEWLSRETGESYRLLSEAEWEYAARAGTRTARYWEKAAPGQCRYANGADASSGFEWATDCDDGYARTSPVGSFEPNGFDLHDVLGNAWEWVEDCWHENYEGAPRDGRAWLDGQGGDCSRRVLRGGSWGTAPENLRSTLRNRIGTGGLLYTSGFRLLRPVRAFTP